MTAEQIDLASKIRSLKIMFSDTECDKIPLEAKNLVQGMTKNLLTLCIKPLSSMMKTKRCGGQQSSSKKEEPKKKAQVQHFWRI